MAENTIIYNDGGIYRFRDYISQIPEFLRSEEDVIVLLQLFSDYINNAYRNIDYVKKFEFKLITVESRVGVTIKQLGKLADLLDATSTRNEKVLFLSKPISVPLSSNNYFLGIFEYDGSLENLTPSAINIDLTSANDGQRAYIEFTKYPENSGSYVYNYNSGSDTLTLDPFSTSQDPFLNTANKPIPTVGGLSPRIIEFKPSNVSKIYTRKIKQISNTVYFEVYFTAILNDITSIASIEAVELDTDEDGVTNETYLIDYYKSVDTLPSSYKYRYFIDFTNECGNFNWNDPYEIGKGLFYARDLTQYVPEALKNNEGNNIYVDPTFIENTKTIPVSSITRTNGNTVTAITKYPHNLHVGDTINISGSSSYFNEIDKVITDIKNSIEFVYTDTGTNTSSTYGNVVLTNLSYYKKNNKPEKFGFYLKVPYSDLDLAGSIEYPVNFSADDIIVRLTDREELKYNTFDGANVDIITHYITLYSDPSNFKLVMDDKVTLRGTGTITMPTGLTEGSVYTVANIMNNYGESNTYLIKLTDAVITVVGSGKINIVKLNVYFNGLTDVNISTNEITLNGGINGNDDPIEGLKVGDAIKIRGLGATGSAITLPLPLDENITYKILTIDKDNNKITLSLDGINELNIETTGVGTFDIIKFERTNDIGVVNSVEVDVANTSGKLILKKYSGEFITGGTIGKLTDDIIDFRATLNSTATAWSKVSSNGQPQVYKKDDLVEYKGIRYKVLKSLTISEPTTEGSNLKNTTSLTPDVNKEFYLKSMDDITIPKYNIKKNPYMVGMFRVKPLEYDEEPDFNSGFDDLGQDLYIKKIQDLELKYGHDQREWFFNPRQAPIDNLVRNGFLEVIKTTDLENDIVNIDAEPYTKTNASYPLLLEGTNLTITRTITSLKYSSTTELATAICNDDHRLKNGLRIIISGATDSGYNGAFQITVVDSTTFTYIPTTAPTLTTDTGSPIMTFYNTVVHDIAVLSVYDGTTVKVITDIEEHGIKNGLTITISGADDTDYNGTYTAIIEDSFDTNEFRYTVADTSGFTDPDTSAVAIVSYQPVDGDYINANNQIATSDRGIYVVSTHEWLKFDDTQVTQNTVIFAQQNLFDVTDNNPTVALGDVFIASLTRSSNDVTVTLNREHDYIVGTLINIENALQSEYNGKFSVSEVVNTKTIKYKIKTTDEPTSPATATSGKTITCQSDKWYKYTINEITWQKLSNSLTYSIASGNTEYIINPYDNSTIYENNVTLYGEYDFEDVEKITAMNATNDTLTLNDITSYVIDNEVIYNASGTEISGLTNDTTYLISAINTTNKTVNLKTEAGLPVTISGTLPAGTHTLTKDISFVEGDLVTLNDQIIPYENGTFRVQKENWKRLNTKLVMKITDITVDNRIVEASETYEVEDPILYTTYNETEVDAYITANFSGNLQVYKIYNTLATNFEFLLEKVENMDTTKPMHRMYDAKYDKNTVANITDMDSSFVGVPDMNYPLVEKIERLAYLKDPNVIDFDFISYLARYMGYDMTPLTDDISESTFYKTDEEKEMAVRKILQNIPQFNTLKATKTGLDMLLLTFGIVGKIVTMWTEANKPYEQFIPDYMVRDVQYGRMFNDEAINLIPTPHFKLDVNIEGNFDNQLSVRELKRLTDNIKIYKPINTVFDGVIPYIKPTLNASVYAGNLKAIGRLQADVGYTGIEFDYGTLIDSDCL